jgi:formate dehydrogenase subunit delta
MSDTELEHLIKMLNQIADNVAIGESDELVARGVANHVERFWAPSMREKINRYADSDGEKLQAASKLAIELLKTQPPAAQQ